MITVGICKLYIVEDDAEDLNDMISFLRDHDIINFIEFKDADDLLQAVGNEICIIILDHDLRKTNGIQVTRELKKRNRYNFIIGYSGISDPTILKQYINCDIDKWVDKNEKNCLNQLLAFIIEGVDKIKDVLELITNLKKQIHDS